MDENNGLLLLELNPPNPWDLQPRSPEELAFGEVQITYLTHACMSEICYETREWCLTLG